MPRMWIALLTPGYQDTCQKHPQCTTASSHSHGLQLSGNRFCSERKRDTHNRERDIEIGKNKEFRKRARQEREVKTRCPATTAGNAPRVQKQTNQNTQTGEEYNSSYISFVLDALVHPAMLSGDKATIGTHRKSKTRKHSHLPLHTDQPQYLTKRRRRTERNASSCYSSCCCCGG